MNLKHFSAEVLALPPAQLTELLDVSIRLIPSWLNGELQSHKKLPKVPGLELSVTKANKDYLLLARWLVYFRGFTLNELPTSLSPMFTAYRTKKELTRGDTLEWESPIGPLTTWFPDAVTAITSSSNQGRSNVTTLLQAELAANVILLDGKMLIPILNWVKINRQALLDLIHPTKNKAISMKPAIMVSIKQTVKTLQKQQPVFVYLTKPISVTVIGSYNAAGG